MSKFYTHFTRRGNNILEIGYENGKKYAKKVGYYPTVYMSTDKTHRMENSRRATCSSRESWTVWVARHSRSWTSMRICQTSRYAWIYGTKNYAYAYINEQYPDAIVHYDRSSACVWLT